MTYVFVLCYGGIHHLTSLVRPMKISHDLLFIMGTSHDLFLLLSLVSLLVLMKCFVVDYWKVTNIALPYITDQDRTTSI